ncbi:MAG: DUF1501 domain-containing protein [Verrucomicrobia bacterium]|nr:DUF1501 domain-containing protein [Verrucomicrobiota bacterium]
MNIGLAGFASLSLPGLLRLRAENATKPQKEKTAVIMVWLIGGLSHIDTYDPKPDATSEYRGPFKVIPTNVPGMNITELLPLHAKIADKFTLIRSMTHRSGGHPAGHLRMLTGDPDERDKTAPRYPDWMCVSNYLRSKIPGRTSPLPNYVAINPIEGGYAGPAYLGNAYSAFSITDDPSRPNFQVPNIGLANAAESRRLSDRTALRQNLDTLERSFDKEGELGALDQFESQAVTLLTNPKTRDAFDLGKEDDRTRDRYGRNRWGQQLLLARRLVESGVEIIHSNLDGPLCGTAGNNWDDHAVNAHVFDGLRYRCWAYDQAVTALIEDIHARGLAKRVMVVVTGEFGRTPKISYDRSTGAHPASGAAGTLQPGRDHWPRCFTNLWAGGGIHGGGVIGSSDKRGEDPDERPCSPGDFLATLYHHLGIDWENTTIKDLTGRPTHIVSGGRPIAELVG